MSRGGAQRWNARYARDGEAWLRHPPKQLLLDYIHLLPPQGRVLDAASGVGSNSEFLAQKGFQVVLMDISWVAGCAWPTIGSTTKDYSLKVHLLILRLCI